MINKIVLNLMLLTTLGTSPLIHPPPPPPPPKEGGLGARLPADLSSLSTGWNGSSVAKTTTESERSKQQLLFNE